MPRITSKLQITIPKRLAAQVGLAAGDEVEFLAATRVHELPALYGG